MTAISAADREALVELGERLRTQNNHYTKHPVYLVQRLEVTTGFDPAYAGDEAVRWYDVDGAFADGEEHDRLEALHEDTGETEDGDWTRTAVLEEWVTVQWFLTGAAAQEYLTANAHRLRSRGSEQGRVWVDSAHRNAELQLLMRVLPMLADELKGVGGGRVPETSEV